MSATETTTKKSAEKAWVRAREGVTGREGSRQIAAAELSLRTTIDG